MNMKKSFLLLCGCLAIASACCNQPAKTAGINYAYMDTTARPGDGFAKYATGHWADLNPSRLSTDDGLHKTECGRCCPDQGSHR